MKIAANLSIEKFIITKSGYNPVTEVDKLNKL